MTDSPSPSGTGSPSSSASPSASASPSPSGTPGCPDPSLRTRSLLTGLGADRSGDYDIFAAAYQAVVAAKPGSAVTVLADGTVPVTAFVPDDLAFRRLVQELRGGRLPSERAATNALVGLGVPTVERVLLYHVVPGATVNAKAALKADGASLTTAQGSPVTVKISLRYPRVTIALGDRKSTPDPRVVEADLNSGNRQIAHGVDAVLRLPTP